MESPLIQSIDPGGETQIVVQSETQEEEEIEKQGEQPPYSCKNDLLFFLRRGVPMSLAAILEWGLPPVIAMGFAGQTSDSEHLQTVLGYARVFYNVTSLMVACGGFSYLSTVVPGALGADRRDRIPVYFLRSLIHQFILMIPSFVLQFFAEPILKVFNVHEDVASEVSIYTKWYIIVVSGMILEANFQIVYGNFLWNKLDAFVSFATGMFLDVFCSWLFIYHFEYGIYGIIWTNLCVKAARVLCWLIFLYPTAMHKVIFYSSTTSKEPLFSWDEFKIAFGLSIPSILSCFSGWLIFEVQILVLANISGVPKAAMAAGAVWIQLESVMASIQTGWIGVANLRTVYLLGRKDPNSFNAWRASCTYANILVAITNILLWVFSESIIRALSNDPDVRYWLDRFWWILVIQSQIRVICIISSSPLAPAGYAAWKTKVNWLVYYGIATPIIIFVCLTDYVTTDFIWKMRACFSVSTFGMMVCSAIYLSYLLCTDWSKLAEAVASRANSDEKEEEEVKYNIFAGSPPANSPLSSP